jgi:hypothetical protein
MPKYVDGEPCTKCGGTLWYTKRKQCVACNRRMTTDWKKANPNRAKESDRNWRLANPDRVKANKKNWANDNPEKRRAATRKWNSANPHIMNANCAKRRVRRIQATIYPEYDWLIQAFYARAQQLTDQTGIPHEVDHIIPLYGKNEALEHVVCGLHIPTNLDIVSVVTNRLKSCKFYDEYDIAA